MPPSGSTTIPSIRRSSPQIRSTRAASCSPSTQIRLALATWARTPATATEPDAVRPGPRRRGRCRSRPDQRHQLALQQEAGRQHRELPAPAEPVLQGDGVALLAGHHRPAQRDHRAAVAVRRLDHQLRLRGHLPDSLAGAGGTGGQHVVGIHVQQPRQRPSGQPRYPRRAGTVGYREQLCRTNDDAPSSPPGALPGWPGRWPSTTCSTRSPAPVATSAVPASVPARTRSAAALAEWKRAGTLGADPGPAGARRRPRAGRPAPSSGPPRWRPARRSTAGTLRADRAARPGHPEQRRPGADLAPGRGRRAAAGPGQHGRRRARPDRVDPRHRLAVRPARRHQLADRHRAGAVGRPAGRRAAAPAGQPPAPRRSG